MIKKAHHQLLVQKLSASRRPQKSFSPLLLLLMARERESSPECGKSFNRILMGFWLLAGGGGGAVVVLVLVLLLPKPNRAYFPNSFQFVDASLGGLVDWLAG